MNGFKMNDLISILTFVLQFILFQFCIYYLTRDICEFHFSCNKLYYKIKVAFTRVAMNDSVIVCYFNSDNNDNSIMIL